MKKTFLFFGLAIIIAFSTQNVLAQLSNDGGYADNQNTFLPPATGSTNTGLEEENIYLQETAPLVQDTITKTPAQTTNGKLSGVYEGTRLACPYAFERDLQVGSKGEDVRLLQVILNGDKRTIIALNGAGSLGKETNTFGDGTKVALKKFQALFIEYVGVANGRFGPRTRTVVNAICNGDTTSKQENSYNNVQSVQKDATPQGEITEIPNDKISPRVSLSANLNTVEAGNSFKVVANFSEEIKPITPDSVIVDGGVVKEIRKLSKTSYSITITPTDDVRMVIVQVEADKIQDLAGNLNENASNEINVKVKSLTANNTASSTDIASLDGLVNKVVSSAPSCNYDNQGTLVTINPNTGTQINTSGCPTTKTAAYNSQIGCYADSGPLPNGISETQRCSNPQNPNNPNSPCSAQNQAVYRQQLVSYQQQMQQQSMYGYGYGYGYISQPPQNPCQNSQVANATQQQAQQQVQQAQQAAQQNAQNQGLGQLLGSLLGKSMQGGGQKDGQGGQNGSGGNGGGAQTGQTSAEAQYQAKCKGKPVDDKECQDLAVKANEENQKAFCSTEEGKNNLDCSPKLCTDVACLNKEIGNTQAVSNCNTTGKDGGIVAGKKDSSGTCIPNDSNQRTDSDGSKGIVKATHEEIKKQCGYLAKTSGTSTEIIDKQGMGYINYFVVKVTDGAKSFLVLQKSTSILNKISNGQDFLKNTTNTKKVEYKCCEDNNFWEKPGYETAKCKTPGPLNKLDIYELNSNVRDLGEAGFSSKK